MSVSTEVTVTLTIRSDDSGSYMRPTLVFQRTLHGASIAMGTTSSEAVTDLESLDVTLDITPEDARELANMLLRYADGTPMVPDDVHQAFAPDADQSTFQE